MRRRSRTLLTLLISAISVSSIFAGVSNGFVGKLAAPGYVLDDTDEPEVTDRVARISFLDGDASLRRAGSDDWEKLALNIPLVEGDEISVGDDAKVEIQFDKVTHLRLDENSRIKLTTLKYEGIAVSMSVGAMSVRLIEFDKDASYFEIDAPRTTVAIQKAGRYELSAKENSPDVRAEISEEGEARIYSETAGFTLKSGRAARIFIDGPKAGEWETENAASGADEFAVWVLDREAVIERQLKNAQYGKYYDDDIYGADDLNDHGSWINTTDYGYVWQPSNLATAQYSNWSPYRYGHWRWVNPFGWTWINDEPWGWATYHHGRWFNYRGRWVWSPYGYYRWSRSWWSPALVVINIYNNNVCWYPLSYYRRRHNYNGWNNQPHRNTKVSTRPPRTAIVNPPGKVSTRVPVEVPATGIVTTDTGQFGKRSMRVQTASDPIAKTVLRDTATDTPAVRLPVFAGTRRDPDLVTEKPRGAVSTRVGAGPQRTNAPLDNDLRTKRMLGDRTPKMNETRETPVDPSTRSTEPRKTGAVERVPATNRTAPVETVPERQTERIPRPAETPRYDPPPVRVEKTQPRETPRYDPPKQTERPRNDPPPNREPPKSEPARQTPKSDPPKAESKPAERSAPPTRKPDTR